MAAAALFLFGLLFGSYATMLTRRLATGEGGMVGGRSLCPACGHALTARDLVPLFSWLFLRGKCRHCRAPIGWRYPLMELCMGLAFAFAGTFLAGAALAGTPAGALRLLAALGIAFVAVAASAYDFERMELPAAFLAPPLVAAGTLAVLGTALPAWDALPWRVAGHGTWGIPAVDAAAGAALLFALIGGQAFLSGERIMGKGDADVAAFAGVVAGWKLGLVAVAAAYVFGSLWGIGWILRGRRGRVPFGPFLYLGLLFALAFGAPVVAHYSETFGIFAEPSWSALP